MAKNIKSLQEYYDELKNSGNFYDSSGALNDEAIRRHMDARIQSIERELAQWDNLKNSIQSYYAELDRLSGKNYLLFNVKDFRDELNKSETDYKRFQRNLAEESKKMNAKWGKATKEEIEANLNEWMADNNKLLKMQDESLKKTQEMAAKAMENFRNGLNVFDRITPRIESRFKGMVKGVNEFSTGLNKSLTSVKEWTQPWAKANQAAANFSKNVGLGAAGMQSLLSETIRFANQAQIGIKYNKSLEEMIKLQQEYTNTVGRNIGLTDNYKESLAAMSAVMGDQKTADISGKLENFGINPEETSRRIGKMYSEAAKKGIAFSKYSDTFANNIKMAQNYTFANGVKGVASMAEKATKLKLEMQSVAQFAEKVNTVEGAVETGAKLQVLGGPFTQFADPLQMLYEGTSDIEGLQNRIINMFGDLGSFNKLTGEVEVSAFNRQRIQAASQAIGINPSELMDMVHAKGKRNEIANQMRGLGYSDDLQELIMNTATFDENGNAGVSLNGQFVGIDQLAGREQELIALNQSESEDIKEIAQMLRGWDDTMQGFQKQKDAKQASWVEKSGIAAMSMQAVQYLGQANWALNTIVGVLTAGKAIGFGTGVYGMTQGGTRTVAGAFYRTRMNNFMKKNGLYNKDLKTSQRHLGKNIGVLSAPDNSFTRQYLRDLIIDRYAGLGAGLDIANGAIPLNEKRQRNNFLPYTTGPGTPSTGPFMGDSSIIDLLSQLGYNSNNGGIAKGGSSNFNNSLDSQGNLSGKSSSGSGGTAKGQKSIANDPMDMKDTISESKKDDDNKLSEIIEQFVEGVKGDDDSPKDTTATTTQTSSGRQNHGNMSRMGRGINPYMFSGGGKNTLGTQVLTLNNGTQVRLGDFEPQAGKNYAINKKTGQKIFIDRNGGLRVQGPNGRFQGSVGRLDANGGIVTGRGVASIRNSKTAMLRQLGKNIDLKSVGMSAAGAGAMMLGAGLSMGASAVDNRREKLIAEGKIKENSKEDWNRRTGSKALSWAGTGASMGASIGMLFGPVGALIGAAAGAIIGGIGGAIKGGVDKKKGMEKEELMNKISRFRNGQRLSGDYDNSTLKRIAKYVETNDSSYITSKELDKLKSNGNDYDIVFKQKLAKGGVINGPSHEKGGVAVAGTGIEVEGGEFVVNKKSTAKNIEILKSINSGASITPKPLDPNIMAVSPSVSSQIISNSPNIGVSEINLKPLDINVNGTIKLDMGKGNNVDISKMILENPQLLRNITEMIEKQININVNGAYNKEKSLKKW